MSNAYYLGIDISTTSAKALLMDQTGQVLTSATTALSLSTPRPLWSEQHPHDWWQAVIQASGRCWLKAGLPVMTLKQLDLPAKCMVW